MNLEEITIISQNKILNISEDWYLKINKMTPLVQICINMCSKEVILNHHHGDTTKILFSTTHINSCFRKHFLNSHLKSFLQETNYLNSQNFQEITLLENKTLLQRKTGNQIYISFCVHGTTTQLRINWILNWSRWLICEKNSPQTNDEIVRKNRC